MTLQTELAFMFSKKSTFFATLMSLINNKVSMTKTGKKLLGEHHADMETNPYNLVDPVASAKPPILLF